MKGKTVPCSNCKEILIKSVIKKGNQVILVLGCFHCEETVEISLKLDDIGVKCKSLGERICKRIAKITVILLVAISSYYFALYMNPVQMISLTEEPYMIE